MPIYTREKTTAPCSPNTSLNGVDRKGLWDVLRIQYYGMQATPEKLCESTTDENTCSIIVWVAPTYIMCQWMSFTATGLNMWEGLTCEHQWQQV